MEITTQKIADLVGGKIIGNNSLTLTNIAKIEDAQSGDLTFLYHPSYTKYLSSTKASAVLINPDMEKSNPEITYIEVDAPERALHKVMLEFFNPQFFLEGIDKSACIDPSAILGTNVAIGKNVVISAGCRIGDNTKIFHNTVLNENVIIGNNSLLHSSITIRENCQLGNNVIVHSGTVIGSDGFGYSKDKDGRYIKIPQIGNVVIEDDVEIGSNVSLDRAAMGSTLVKRGSKIDNLVQVAHNVVIGEDTAISAQTGISGSTKIGSNCILAGQVGLAGHIEICDGVMLGAQSGISKSIKKPGLYFGYPAREMGTAARLEAHIRNLPNYAEKIKSLEKELNELKANIKDNK